VLDEVNALRPLTNLIKSVVTGGEIKRRVLYTTDTERAYPIDVALMMSANVDSATDQALIDRCVKLDMGDPAISDEGWRGDFGVRQEWKRNDLRQQCWIDLVSRCAAAMRYLKAAVDKGVDDIRVAHRMSGFWSFAEVIAHQESAETESLIAGAMAAITLENRSVANTIDDILPLLQQWLQRRPEMQGKRFTAGQVGAALMAENVSVYVRLPTHPSSMSKAVQELLCSSYRLSNRLNGSAEYRRLLGMQVHRGHQGKEFSFSLSPSSVADPKADGTEPEAK
jgi:hypothetical protein